MSRKTLKTTVTLAAVLATAVVAPAGASVGTESPYSNDLRSPDARDAVVANTGQDLRSPDARDASKVVVVASTGQDLRSPDARDAGKVVPTSTGQDLRSPDARDAGKVVPTSTGQDLRSPDARDAGKVVATSNGQDLRSPDARDVSRPNTSPVPSSAPSTGTDWGDVGMVGGAIALALLAAGGLILISRRRATVAPS
jgi:LPXTG-motif cell wall-anchored protein